MHARREFFDARPNEPRGAHYMLSLMGQSYDIKDEIPLQGTDERAAARQERSVPILVGRRLSPTTPGAP